MRELETDSLRAPRRQGTAYYSLLVYAGDRHDHSMITLVCDKGVVRLLTYTYHDYLSGRNEMIRLPNPGNGDYRDERFAFSKLSDLVTRYRQFVRASPDEDDDYYLVLKDFVVYRILQLINHAGVESSDNPLVVHLTTKLKTLEEYFLTFLRRPVRDSLRRAGNLEFA